MTLVEMDERLGCDLCWSRSSWINTALLCDRICQNCGTQKGIVIISNQQSQQTSLLWKGGGSNQKPKTMWFRGEMMLDSIIRNGKSISQLSPSFKLNLRHSVFLHLLFTLLVVLSLSVSVLDAQCSPTTDCSPAPLHLATETIVNSNPWRTLEVSSTCGPTTEYRKSSLTFNNTNFFCYANNNSHPAINMLDRTSTPFENFQSINPMLLSYWQSDNSIVISGATPTPQSVTYNMTDNFLIRYFRVIFLSPFITSENDNSDMRPRAMVFEKYNSLTDSWEALRYYAMNCTTHFPKVPKQNVDGTGPSYEAQIAVCMEKYYGGDSKTYSGWGYGRQEVQFAPSREYDPEFKNSYTLQKHFLTNMVRLRLVVPADDQPLSSYYAIADLEITGQCACFGHASACTGPNEAQCLCSHNTTGDNCEMCEPLYNNKPWRMGANNLANACEDCGCNGHATVCHYEVGKGYGVCDNCTLNTAGDKCEFCEDFYYVNPLKDLYANGSLINPGSCSGYNGTAFISYSCSSWCIPCNCSLDGSSPLTQYNCQNATGQCDCKINVEGRACDMCKDGFWNLTDINTAGCQACTCDLRGTINNSNLCDKTMGDCICKNNTQGKNCGECKVGFFELSQSNPAGCTPCDCDPGASFDIVCPRVGGTCSCRSLIGGRTCKLPFSGRYVPALDHLTFDAEFATNATTLYSLVEKSGHGEVNGTVTGRGYVDVPSTGRLVIQLSVPRTHQYSVILRYQSTSATWSNTAVVLQVKDPGGAGVSQYECGGANYTISRQFTLTKTLALATEGREVMGTACLNGNTQYTATVTVGTPSAQGQKLLLDSLLFLPNIQTLANWVNSDATRQAATQACYDLAVGVNTAERVNSSCSQYDYSVMANLYNGSVACSCESLGSSSLVCNANGGQCPCKPGVMLLDCSQCKVDHYGYSSGQGCTPCNCHPQASVKSACNDTGICDCKANVTNIKCDSCIPEHWGLTTGNGCSPCTCHGNYSLNNSCMDSGQCYCKPGIGEKDCTQCLDGFYNLTTERCTNCGCNADGSTTLTCDKTTGVCICKTNTQGEKCDQCKDGFFGLGSWSHNGCLSCYCSSHSSNCTSASDYRQSVISTTWSLLEGISATETYFTALDENGNSIDILTPTKIVGISAERVMRIVNEGSNLMAEQYYYNATMQYLGSKRGAYGQNLTVSLTLTIPPPPENTTIDYINSTGGDIVIQGVWTYFRLVAWLPTYPTENVTSYNFDFHESNWRINSSSGPTATYQQMVQTLADIRYINIRAKFTNATGAVTDLHTALLYYSEKNGTLAGAVNNVEACVCPPAYTGEFCEKCAPGYTRRNPFGGPDTECVQCMCNGHQTGPQSCDPDSGVCVCTHNTTGDHCQKCLDGYYGDSTVGASGDCRPCLCPGNALAGEANSFATTCQVQPGGGYVCDNCTVGHGGSHCEFCVNNWYGTPTNASNNDGKCSGCVCNSRADTCNTTSGFCTDCRNNTAGKECEICAPKYFGNAMAYSCKECNCTKLGATGDCDHRTGQCVCKPHVTGFECDQCEALSFNYSSGLGCELCDCHPTGSLSRGCNVTSGECLCRGQVAGRRCDICKDTYWHINFISGCDPCGCTSLGTKNETLQGKTFGTCDLNSGQCQCAVPGIIGRTCDHCAKGTLGTYPDCELCGECYDNWAKKIDEVGLGIQAQHNLTLDIWQHYNNLMAEDVSSILQQMQSNLTDVDSSIANALEMVNRLNYLRDGFNTVLDNVTSATAVLDGLQRSINDLTNQLAFNQNFQGVIPVNATTTRTPYQLENDTKAIQAHQERIYTEANKTWASIQNYTDVITSSNGSAKLLQQRVSEALTQLSLAKRDRLAAEMILNGSFTTEYTTNSLKIQTMESHHLNFSNMINVARNQLNQAEILAKSANVTATEAEMIRAAKAGAVDAQLAAAQITKFNASQAQTAGQMAQSAARIYMNLATSTKNDMTSALEEVANGIKTLRNIQAKVDEGNTLRLNISATNLRPFPQLQVITSKIESTTISAEAVAKTSASAQAGLRVAQEALSITKRASEASHKVLEQVKGIQSDLQLTKTAQTEISRLEASSTSLNTSINTILTQVNQKSSSALTLGQTTTANINSVSSFIQTIKSGFVSEQLKATAARTQAQQAEASSSTASVTQAENTRSLINVTSLVSVKKVSVDGSLAQLSAVDTDLKRLETDLANLDTITNLQRMQNEFASQKSEISSLSTQLANLESELNTLISQLVPYSADTATCTHS